MLGMAVLQSLALFVLAGVCEIGGGYLFWLWLREGRSVAYALWGIVVWLARWLIARITRCVNCSNASRASHPAFAAGTMRGFRNNWMPESQLC